MISSTVQNEPTPHATPQAASRTGSNIANGHPLLARAVGGRPSETRGEGKGGGNASDRRASMDGRSASSRGSGSRRSAPGAPSKPTSLSADAVVERLHQKLGHEGKMSLTEHVSGGRMLCRLRDRIASGDRPTPRAAIRLLATGISLHRRFSVGDCGGGDLGGGSGPTDETAQQEMLDDSRELVRVTAVRIFALLCMLELDLRMAQVERGLQALDVDGESRRAVATFGMSSVWDMVRDPPPRRKKARTGGATAGPAGAASAAGAATQYDTESGAADEADDEADDDEVARGETEAATCGWEQVLRATSADVARHALRIGASCLDDESWKALDSIMPLFFRNSAFNMGESLLLPDGDRDHTSLGVAAALAEMTQAQRDKKLLSIAQAGESEAGQSVTRDLMLSFMLPNSGVGVRRTLLLTRAASTQAGVDHPTLVSRAHDVAMAGTEWIWENGTDPLERMCCLLAGVAILTTKGDEDPIRKADAFGGRVQLPFFETRQPEPRHVRIALVPSARRWVLFRLDKRGMPKVLLSQRGFEGMCNAVLQLVASLR